METMITYRLNNGDLLIRSLSLYDLVSSVTRPNMTMFHLLGATSAWENPRVKKATIALVKTLQKEGASNIEVQFLKGRRGGTEVVDRAILKNCPTPKNLINKWGRQWGVDTRHLDLR